MAVEVMDGVACGVCTVDYRLGLVHNDLGRSGEINRVERGSSLDDLDAECCRTYVLSQVAGVHSTRRSGAGSRSAG